ncbi:helix-turn-helix domain-containing protein [Massilia sp. CF038]|uniref:helix-turn-helix domain-containing protein n=1 Tax=Massilia sp. CF038 TaxID=1881045 RepID=UPI000920F8B9|nr:helix-turn-helix domain-containing protein [Massilia sp. CF038]SHG64559.1 AraC-type DNA-binding protein [Massilia sp. CF038]
MTLLLPAPALTPFVKQLWYADTPADAQVGREHILPTGQMHLVFRLAGAPLKVFDSANDQHGAVAREPVVGGPRASFYVKESGLAVSAIGVQLLPGAAMSLFGVSAAELAERHTPLSELWGAAGRSALDRIAQAGTPLAQLRVLECLLAERLPRIRAMHPAVAQLLSQPGQLTRIDTLVRDSRYSHRGFIALFREATGMSPKRYARLMRFRTVLARLRQQPGVALGALAQDAGYSDQAHMHREFRAFAGVTPRQYVQLDPVEANHLVLR